MQAIRSSFLFRPLIWGVAVCLMPGAHLKFRAFFRDEPVFGKYGRRQRTVRRNSGVCRMVNEDAASESERYGRTSGVITLSYEDAAGEIYTVEKELTVQINPLQMNTMLNTETSEDTDMTGQLIAAAAAAAGIIVIGTMIPLLIRRRRRRKDDEA